jgi:Oxysterol-binding protein
MHTRDTALAGKACEPFPLCLCRLHIHLNPNSNPLLAETFEIPQLKFIAEKVSHHPVVMAYHAEGEGWEICATSSGRTKFWGA